MKLGSLAASGGQEQTRLRASMDAPNEEITLEVATITEDGWEPEAVSRENHVGGGSLQLDSGGGAHLGFLAWDPSEVLYATDGPGEWSIETAFVPAGDQPPVEIVLVLDPEDSPILVVSNQQRDVLVARRDGGVWELETAAQGAEDSRRGRQQLSAGVDADGHLHGVFAGAGGIHYFSDESGSWTTETATERESYSVDLAVGADGIHLLATLEADATTQGQLAHLVRPEPNGVDDDCDGVPY